jgi:hypothetical protein
VPTLSRTVVAAPPATVPPHSLIRAAITNRDAEPGWERGLAYAPETPGGYRAYLPCSAETFDDYAAGPATPVVDYLPWELQVEHPCHSTFGYTRQAVDDELRRAIDATESFAIARELMAGDLARAARAAGDLDPGQNLALVDDPTVLAAGTAVSPTRALGLIEAAVGGALRGQQAYLHVPPEVEPYLPNLQVTGNLLTTRRGSLVVVDAGYPNIAPDGADPADGVGWIYGTGTVVVRRSVAFADGDEVETLDTATNTLTRRTSKRVAATFDRAALFAVPVTLT